MNKLNQKELDFYTQRGINKAKQENQIIIACLSIGFIIGMFVIWILK